ncbi:MAG: DUF4870 domain-containing protein [Deltaproteobacteria bacterium]|nr:DUF4870 domain-containing protein [Deltaproteobacteria bacterium]
MLCYICMPVTSIIFMLLEKDNKDIQFHAWQGAAFGIGYILVVIAIEILSTILTAIISFLGMLVGLLVPLVGLAAFVVWIVCLVKSYQGERWKIPYIGDFAEKKAGLA